MAISKAHPDFTSFVNGVLTNERADGTWAAIYNRWLGAATAGSPHQPARRLLRQRHDRDLARRSRPPHRGTGRHPGAHAGEPG